MKAHQRHIHQQLEKFNSTGVTHFSTNGRFSSYHVLEYLLQITGVSVVSISTFSISEDAIVMLSNAKRRGNISYLNLYLNVQCKQYFNNLMPLAKRTADMLHFSRIHAKLIVIQSDTHHIAVETSSNFSNNTNRETGTVFTQPDSVLWFSKFLNKINGRNS